MNKIIRLTDTEFKALKEIAEEEGRKQALSDVKSIIIKWYGNQPKNRTEKTIDELLEEINKLEKGK